MLLFTCYVFIIGTLVGSFLNVVAYRLPRRESVAYPASHCPKCGHAIRARDNIPIISWLFLMGKCRDCKALISWEYPAVELISGVLSGFVAWHFGIHWNVLPALLLTWVLLVLFIIDAHTYTLPNVITKTGIMAGLAINVSGWVMPHHVWTLASPESSLLGVVVGYGSLWILSTAYLKLTGKHGMGGGDLKMLGLIGAFIGLKAVILTLFIAAALGGLVGVCLLIMGRDAAYKIPFGPYLATGAWISMLWAPVILKTYWSIMGV